MSDNENKNLVYAAILSVVLILIAAGSVFLYLNFNKKIGNDKDGFTRKELEKTVAKVAEYKDETERELFGFSYNTTDEKFVVNEVIPESPAQKAGIKKDDVIIKLNDVDTQKTDRETWSKIINELDKPQGKFTVKRKKKTLEFDLTKAKVKASNTCGGCGCTALYLNSTGFNEKYAYGYFKVPQGPDTYNKTGVYCNCDEKERIMTTFWTGTYNNDELSNEVNHLKDKKLVNDKADPGTPADYMCNVLCTQKANYIEPAAQKEQKANE